MPENNALSPTYAKFGRICDIPYNIWKKFAP